MHQPRLLAEAAPDAPAGLVLLLHGGAHRRDDPMVSPAQLSVLRMIPLARRFARAGRGRLGVYRLLNSHRGWDATHTPADDARWALDVLAGRFGDEVPVCLVGHSLGGRAALLAGPAPAVTGVVALNPWVRSSDHVDLSGRDVLVVHGDADRVASIDRARSVAERLARSAEVSFVTVRGGRHAMLRHRREFEAPAVDFGCATLLGEPCPGR